MLRKFLVFISMVIALSSCYKTDPSVLEFLKQIQSQNEFLKTQVQTMQKTTDSIAKSLANISSTTAAQSKQLDSIKTQLTLVLSQINLLNTQLLSTNANITDIQAKLVKLQATCDQLLSLLQTCCNTPFTIGQIYGGGKIAYVDSTGKHGLIISLDEIAGGLFAWRLAGDTTTNAVGAFYDDGNLNTNLLISLYGTGNASIKPYAALAARNYNGGGFNDWYLPSYVDFGKISETRNKGIDLNIGPDIYYLTSSEDPWNNIGRQVLLWGSILNYGKGGYIGFGKNDLARIRAIRKF